MTALKDKLAEQARIKSELQRMETSEETTEENDGDLRDTLIERWKQLDEETKPIIKRMSEIQAITRAAEDESNLERPDPGYDGNGGGGARRTAQGAPDFWGQSGRSPYEDLDAVRAHMVKTPELRGRAFDAIELEAKRGNLAGEFAENATGLVQRNQGIEGRRVAEHILTTGSEEYQEMFRAYLEDPQGMAARAALSLTLANGGFVMVAAA